MSRKLLAFLLSELSTIRLKCLKCSGVSEVSLKLLEQQFAVPICPMCRTTFLLPTMRDSPFVSLSAAIQTLQLLQKNVEVEFILNDPSGTAPTS